MLKTTIIQSKVAAKTSIASKIKALKFCKPFLYFRVGAVRVVTFVFGVSIFLERKVFYARAPHPEAPLTYPQIFKSVNPDHVVVANGEEDNVFRPGMTYAARWSLAEEAFVGKSESVLYTADVQPGTYVFALSPDPSVAGGDGDLRVRAGAMPGTDQTYKCKSYVGNTNERCKLTVTSPQRIYMTVTGDAAGVQSHFLLRAFTPL